MLAYNVFFVLDYFEWSEKTLNYKGFTSFQEHIFSGERDKIKADFKRRFAYKGTIMQFLRYTFSGYLEWSEFEIYNEKGESLELQNIVHDNNNIKQLCYNNLIVIDHGKIAGTFLQLKDSCVQIFENGYCNPEQISISGSMGKFRVGDMLPYDYMPKK